MNHTGCTAHGSLHRFLVGILLPHDSHVFINGNRAEPEIGVILSRFGLRMHVYSGHAGQQFFVQCLHMLVMADMCLQHGHLPAPYAGTDIAHSVVIANCRMLVVGICVPCLCGIPHNLVGIVLGCRSFSPVAYQRSAAGSGNHLVAIEREDAKAARRSQNPAFVARPHTLGSILYDGNAVLVGHCHDTVYPVRHAVQGYGYYGLGIVSCLCLAVQYGQFEQFGVHVPRLTLRIHEHRFGPKISNRVGRCTERKRLHYHLVTGLNPTGNQGQMHCRRTGGQAYDFR